MAAEIKKFITKHLVIPVWFHQEALDPHDGWTEVAPTKGQRIVRSCSVMFSDGSSRVWRLLAAAPKQLQQKKNSTREKRVSKK